MNSDTTFGNLLKELRLAFHILRDPDTPFYVKMLPLASFLYFIFPEGLLMLPLATPIDDAAVLYVALKGLINLAPPQIVAKYQKELGMDVVEGEFEVVEADMADKELDAHIVLNPDRMNAE